MVLDIHRRVIQIQLSRFISSIVFVVVEIAFLFFLKFKSGAFSNKMVAAILLGLFLVYKLIERLLELNYIYFTDKDDTIIFRYFSMSYFSRQKNSIEINKAQFGGYELKRSMLGYKKAIVLIHKVGKKVARYKPVSLSALTEKELTELKRSLDSIKVVK